MGSFLKKELNPDIMNKNPEILIIVCKIISFACDMIFPHSLRLERELYKIIQKKRVLFI